jgi:hypothetical protein
MSSDAALRAAQARLAAGISDARVTPRPSRAKPVVVTAVTVQHCERCGGRTIVLAVACAVCGRDFEPKRADARYCSGACRMAAYRARRRS